MDSRAPLDRAVIVIYRARGSSTLLRRRSDMRLATPVEERISSVFVSPHYELMVVRIRNSSSHEHNALLIIKRSDVVLNKESKEEKQT